jgi:hypothetical protein
MIGNDDGADRPACHGGRLHSMVTVCAHGLKGKGYDSSACCPLP